MKHFLIASLLAGAMALPAAAADYTIIAPANPGGGWDSTGRALGKALQDAGVPLHDAADMDSAVTTAASLAQSGDAVLMSPACASLDMFDNYGHRAQVFCQAVAALADAAGFVTEGGL